MNQQQLLNHANIAMTQKSSRFRHRLIKASHKRLINSATDKKKLPSFRLNLFPNWSSVAFSINTILLKLKNYIADSYIVFFIGVVNHETLSRKFVMFTTLFGLFCARQIIKLYSVSYPTSLLFLCFIPLFMFVFTTFFLIEIFKLALRYPKFGKKFVNFFKNNASNGALILVGLKPPSKNKQRYSSCPKNKKKNFNETSRRFFHFSSKRKFTPDEVGELLVYFDAKKQVLQEGCSPSLRGVLNKILAGREQMDYWTAMSILDICAIDEDTASRYVRGEYNQIFKTDADRILREAINPILENQTYNYALGSGISVPLFDWTTFDYNAVVKSPGFSLKHNFKDGVISIGAEYTDPETNSKIGLEGKINPYTNNPSEMVVISGEAEVHLSQRTISVVQRTLPMAMIPVITSAVAATGFYLADRVTFNPIGVAESFNVALDQQRISSENQIPTPENSPTKKLGSSKTSISLKSNQNDCCQVS